MSSVSPSSSLSSSIDTLVQQYRSSLITQQVTPVQTRQAALTSRLSALSTLKTNLSALHDSASGIAATDSSSQFNVFGVANSNPSVLTASASSGAAVGTHTVLVSQLAKTDTVISSRFNSSTTTILSNELTADEKTAGSANRQIKILVGGSEKATVDVGLTWNPTADTNGAVLSKIAAAINASADANKYVTASVVSVTPTQSRLVLTGIATGSSNAVSLQDGGQGTLLENIGLTSDVISGRTAASASSVADDPVNNKGGYLYAGDAGILDAKFQVDGIDIERQSNSITDVLSGVTLQLQSTQASDDTPVSLTVSSNSARIKSSIQQFLNSYNAAINYINTQSAIDPQSGTRQIFATDTFVRNIRTDLRTIMMSPVSGLVSGSSLLSDLGITSAQDGTLSISDTSKLDAALSSDPKKVAAIFVTPNGVAGQVQTYLDKLVNPSGQMDSVSTGVSDQIKSMSTKIDTLNANIDKQVQQFQAEFAQLQTVYDQATQEMQFIQEVLGTTTTTY